MIVVSDDRYVEKDIKILCEDYEVQEIWFKYEKKCFTILLLGINGSISRELETKMNLSILQ